jgi:hypothetical protein
MRNTDLLSPAEHDEAVRWIEGIERFGFDPDVPAEEVARAKRLLDAYNASLREIARLEALLKAHHNASLWPKEIAARMWGQSCPACKAAKTEKAA